MVGECCPGDYERQKNAAGHRLEQDVEATIEDCSDSAGVEGKVRDREP